MRALCFQETTCTFTKLALWLSTEEMQAWVRKARDKASYQRRLAIWLTEVERLSAHRVAQPLCVSTPAVWRWVQQFNRQGPEGLHRAGRGGRRWAFLKGEQEHRFLECGNRLAVAMKSHSVAEAVSARFLESAMARL